MVKIKNSSLVLLFLVIGILFTGCSSLNKNSDVKVESDENKVEVATPSVPIENDNNQSAVENTADKELITTDDVEIGELI